jgi:hypothetical protein
MIILAFLLVVFAFYALLYRPKPPRRRHGNAAGRNFGTMIGANSTSSWPDGGSYGHHSGHHCGPYDAGGHGGSCGH